MPAFVLLIFVVGVFLVRISSPACVVVTWETASEVDTAGFFIYRGESPDALYDCITGHLILARGDPLVGDSYRYEDREVVWGKRPSSSIQKSVVIVKLELISVKAGHDKVCNANIDVEGVAH